MLYVFVALVFFPDHQDSLQALSVHVNITDSLQRQFISTSDITDRLRRESLYPIGKSLNDVSTQAIEDAVMQFPVLRRVQCYKTCGGDICIDVWQQVPVLRVISDDSGVSYSGANYYVCQDRNILYATSHTACFVPVVTGSVSQEMATTELFDFVSWLRENSFWDAQIEQIVVTPQQDIQLIPRVGSHTIILGKIDSYQQKLQKLQTFYSEAFNQIGWIAYREIDLRFNGQVIGRK